MKILVIGGTGLISSALSRQLVDRGHVVTVYNRGQRDVPLPKAAIKLTGDRYEAKGFVRDMQAAGEFDCVVDMIAYTAADATSLIQAFSGRTAHLIVCSTTDVYQKPAARYPYTEQAHLGGIGDYAQGKLACERMLLAAHSEHALPVTIIRPAHTYGIGGQHRGHVVHSMGKGTAFLDRLRRGKPIIVHGDGSSLWASCHLEDVARAFVGGVENAATVGRVYHATGTECITWDQYHHVIAAAMDAPTPRLVHIPTDILKTIAPNRAALVAGNFQFNNVFDNTAAQRDLGFQQTVPLLNGMREAIRWVESTYGFESSDTDPVYDRLIETWLKMRERFCTELAGAEA